MSDLPFYTVVIDLETAGTDEKTDPILEVGAILVETATLKYLSSYSSIVRPLGSPSFVRSQADPVVQKMHDENGLWEELRVGLHVPTTSQVDMEVSNWLFHQAGGRHVILSGSGVAHFDRRFINAQMPGLSDRLTYWSLDVGVMRRMFQLVGLETTPPTGEKTHRALDDAIWHLRELRWYAKQLEHLKEADVHLRRASCDDIEVI